jgi:hypothetical protein
MGADFQLIGSQIDLQIQVECLEYMREADRLYEAEKGNDENVTRPSTLQEGADILLSNATSFSVADPALNAAVHAYLGATTFSRTRFFGDNQFFMFDRDHGGLICSTDNWPPCAEVENDESGKPFVGAGIRYRGPAMGGLGFRTVLYAVLSKRFVPNLEVHDDYRSHAYWMEPWSNDDRCDEAGLATNWMVDVALDDLPHASLAFFKVFKAQSDVTQARIRAYDEAGQENPEFVSFPAPLTDEIRASWRSVTWDQLDASVRLMNSLTASEFTNLAQLEGKSKREILSEGVVKGRKTLKELTELARMYGLEI